MWKLLLLLFGLSVALPYANEVNAEEFPRNQAMPVVKVVYGTLNSVRDVSRTELEQDRNNGWHTFGGALLGGVIGHQFGDGHGRDVATVLGAIIGAGVGSQHTAQAHARVIALQELIIRQNDGEQVMVIQQPASNMPLQSGDEVRVVYFKTGVRVDKAM
ncbi:glycine zipper 2TM domain-containing protein [Shewanella avicenniae]|uniref:Glycine zipper 2TM domain-containing protein n=1 Tax=Shewanella avicenniae TaxID=2814294 RepID=A0ABX7QMR1_9GAMM|nr:glycine zipper 2TM domain-containing protein [Shewanella avicenniae]QSX32188.1 glycine zipper 2TM domain-containing protein [Shewanella avicenniae]